MQERITSAWEIESEYTDVAGKKVSSDSAHVRSPMARSQSMEKKHGILIVFALGRGVLVHQHFPCVSKGDSVSHIGGDGYLGFIKPGQKSLKMATFKVPRGVKLVVLGPVGIHLGNVEHLRMEYAVANAPWIAIISRFLRDKDSLTRGKRGKFFSTNPLSEGS